MKESKIERYADHYKSNGYTRHNFLFEQDNILSLVSKKEGSLVLDIGCGTGHLIQPLLGKNVIVGLDTSLEILNCAKNKGFQVIQGDGQYLPFRSGIFDVVLCMHAAQIIDDISRLIKDMARVTKKNGEITIATLNEMSILRRILKIVKPSHNYLKLYKIKDIIKILSRNHLFNIEILYDYEPLLYKKTSTNIRLVEQFIATSFIIKARKVG